MLAGRQYAPGDLVLLACGQVADGLGGRSRCKREPGREPYREGNVLGHGSAGIGNRCRDSEGIRRVRALHNSQCRGSSNIERHDGLQRAWAASEKQGSACPTAPSRQAMVHGGTQRLVGWLGPGQLAHVRLAPLQDNLSWVAVYFFLPFSSLFRR